VIFGISFKVASTYLHIFEPILLAYATQHILLAALLHLACQQKLIQYKVCFLEIEDDVEFAHIAVVFVHLLDEAMHDLESDKFIVCGVTAGNEEEGRVSTIYNLGVWHELGTRNLIKGE
jgi:hypothetical protein